MYPTWGGPYSYSGMEPSQALDPCLTSHAMRMSAWLQELAPHLEVLQSLVLDVASAPETRTMDGMAQFHQAFIHLTAAYLAAQGALRRIPRGDNGALTTLAVAGQILMQSGETLRPQLERLIMEADLTIRPSLERIRTGIALLGQPLAQATRAIEALVGPEAWSAAGGRAGELSGYGMA